MLNGSGSIKIIPFIFLFHSFSYHALQVLYSQSSLVLSSILTFSFSVLQRIQNDTSNTLSKMQNINCLYVLECPEVVNMQKVSNLCCSSCTRLPHGQWEHVVRCVPKHTEHSSSATLGLLPTPLLGLEPTGSVVSLLAPFFQIPLNPISEWFVLKFNDLMLSISRSVFSLLNCSVGKVAQECELGQSCS